MEKSIGRPRLPINPQTRLERNGCGAVRPPTRGSSLRSDGGKTTSSSRISRFRRAVASARAYKHPRWRLQRRGAALRFRDDLKDRPPRDAMPLQRIVRRCFTDQRRCNGTGYAGSRRNLAAVPHALNRRPFYASQCEGAPAPSRPPGALFCFSDGSGATLPWLNQRMRAYFFIVRSKKGSTYGRSYAAQLSRLAGGSLRTACAGVWGIVPASFRHQRCLGVAGFAVDSFPAK